MTTQRLCGPQGQPCQSNCGIDCHWETASCPPCTHNCNQGRRCLAHDKATAAFWDASPPGYYELIDAPLNFWDRRGIVGKAATVFGAVLACCLAAGVLVGVMT